MEFLMLFRDRTEAGQRLAEQLTKYANKADVLVLALPRGGVPVAFEVARTLHARMDILVVRKLGVPGQEEVAMGAIASGGIAILNRTMLAMESISKETIHKVAKRERTYRGECPLPVIEGQTVILVDDGLATGSSMHAAVRVIKQQSPAGLIV